MHVPNPASPWGNEDTATLLEILERQDIHATFFFTGGWISKYPEDVKTIINKGHEIGNHSENHKHLGNGSIILMHNGAKYTRYALGR